jgi:hypothetical protein
MRFYCDNSDLATQTGLECPNSIVLGALGVDDACETQLRQKLLAAKQAIGLTAGDAVKWNLRDLHVEQGEIGRNELQLALTHSDSLRRTVINAVADSTSVLVVSVMECYSTDKKTIGGMKKQLASFCFSNLLMRLGYVQTKSCSEPSDTASVVMDWPEGSDYRPFVAEYRSAFLQGRSSYTPNPSPYHCGPLNTLGFLETPFFVSGVDHPMIQIVDIVIGAIRGYFAHEFKGESDTFTTELFTRLWPRFYRENGALVGYGIAVSGRPTFKERIKFAIAPILAARLGITAPPAIDWDRT